MQEDNGNLGQAAVSTAMLGSVERFRNAMGAATDAFRRAERMLASDANGSKFEPSLVRGYYGIFLASQQDWNGAREKLRVAVDAGTSDPACATLRRRCLLTLLDVDKHLRKKSEVRDIRAQLKNEVAQDSKQQSTVDLMALKRTSRSSK